LVILKNCKLYSMEDEGIRHGDILVEDGRIAQIDTGITKSGVPVIDINNNLVLPGLIDGHSHIGLVESGMGFEGNDLNELTDPVNPHLRALDGLNRLDRSFGEAVRAGVTSVAVSPGQSDVIGGQTCIIKTGGPRGLQRVVKKFAALSVSLGDAPKRANHGKVAMPMSRMAEAYLLRKTFQEAQNYQLHPIRQDCIEEYSRFDPGCEALKPVLAGEVPVRVAAHKLHDILTALSIAAEFNLRLILDYCTEGHLLVERLAVEKVPVMLGPYLTDQSSPELLQRNSGAPAIFARAGVLFSLITNHPDVPVQFLPACAGITVKEGLEYHEALKAVTINPAKTLGIAERVGSVREGKDADLIVLDGDPLRIKTRVLMTMIDGEILYEA
jgi:imidazolonepropionase-like amidohydrolase